MIPLNRSEFSALLPASRIKPRLMRTLRFVPEEIDGWEDRDFLAVTTKSGGEGVLLIPAGGENRVIPFSLSPLAASSVGVRRPIICDICRTWRRGTEAARITFPREDGSSVSYLCCGDLLCSFHVRDKTAAAVLSRVQLRENISPEGRVERLKREISGIALQLL